jgi:hypothetical protein
LNLLLSALSDSSSTSVSSAASQSGDFQPVNLTA